MELGDKLRDTRLQKKMTLVELSSRSGVSKSLLSQIERNITIPTIKTIQKVAKALGITMTALFAELEKEQVSKPERDNRDAAGSGAIRIVTKDSRKKLFLPKEGLFYELLSPDLRHKIEFIYIEFPPYKRFEEFLSHEGEECGLILKGKLKGIIGEQVVLLEEGDSIYFDSSIPHRWENPEPTEMVAIWAITPPSF